MIFFLAASESTLNAVIESAAAAVKATALFLKETEAIVINILYNIHPEIKSPTCTEPETFFLKS